VSEDIIRVRKTTSIRRGFVMLTAAACAAMLASCGGEEKAAEDAAAEDQADAPEGTPWRCMSEDDMRCQDEVLTYCVREGEFLSQYERDCEAEGLICLQSPPLGCVLCRPGLRRCEGNDVYECSEDGMAWVYVETCNPGKGELCINGYCVSGCDNSERWKSNVGCLYYPVDLDNAVTQGLDASAQQYAVVVSNPSGAEAVVTVERNDAPPGQEPEIVVVDERIVSPNDLEVFQLDRREVDGSTRLGANNGTGSAITSAAYRLRSTAPIVAYQFNPLDNVQVFSNDASILIPTTALGEEYVVLGWPQTIAETPDYFDEDLRAFLTVVGTDYETQVTLEFPASDRMIILGDGDTIPDLFGGDTFTTTLGPFDTLNLETDGFMADFTGTVISASKPVVVFAGSEASDVPTFDDYTTRQCCADHLEQQLYPVDRSGRKYVAALTPQRTRAVKMAGGDVTVHEEKEYFKLLGLYEDTTVHTTLPMPYDVISLDPGKSVVIETTVDFVVTADKPVSFGQFVASQNVTGISFDLPGGDPVFIMVPPVEQWRMGYIFLTPSLYAFDFIILVHSPEADVLFDGRPFPPTCRSTSVPGAEAEFVVTRCQLSFPEIVEGSPPDNILPGDQDDGVHEILSDYPVGVVVYGFDNYVSYGYPGGTDLRIIE
jgi:hypothetical protein